MRQIAAIVALLLSSCTSSALPAPCDGPSYDSCVTFVAGYHLARNKRWI